MTARTPPPGELGRRIRRIRRRKHLRAKACAWSVGWERQKWYQLESGAIADPRFSSILRVASALGCSLDDLRP
jgi:transcriptional regulator with XRE-family HTH domain